LDFESHRLLCQSESRQRKPFLNPHASFNGHDDDVWDKLGQAVGNLQSLDRILISTKIYLGNDDDDDDDDDEVSPIHDWEMLARILKYARQRIKLQIDNALSWDAEVSRLFARAIHGQPSICTFEGGSGFSYESIDTLYSALATLPALESIKLSNLGLQARPGDISTLANTESLTDLLRAPTFRSVDFYGFSFTPALFQATANALMEGTAINNLLFRYFSVAIEASTAMMTKSLSRNTSVTCINIVLSSDETLCNAMTTALPSNSTLCRLDLGRQNNDDDHNCFSRVLLALGQNTGLKSLIVRGSCSMDELLCAVMRNGLGMNETL
jgi:hypothetical protein